MGVSGKINWIINMWNDTKGVSTMPLKPDTVTISLADLRTILDTELTAGVFNANVKARHRRLTVCLVKADLRIAKRNAREDNVVAEYVNHGTYKTKIPAEDPLGPYRIRLEGCEALERRRFLEIPQQDR
jgi:hypothetical protein